jgi:hypothetical protein
VTFWRFERAAGRQAGVLGIAESVLVVPMRRGPGTCAGVNVLQRLSRRGNDVGVSSLRRFHLDLQPTKTVVDGHQITFVAATFHIRSVMIEYDVDPAIDRRSDPLGINGDLQPNYRLRTLGPSCAVNQADLDRLGHR